MDYRDYQAGATKSFFWHRAKVQFVGVLLDKLKREGGLKILNLGAGTGDDLPVLNQHGETYVIDSNPDALDLIPPDLVADKKVCDACSMSYPDNFFDVVAAFDVLEHIENDSLAISEIYRVLKPGGSIIFTVPAFSFLYSSHDRALDHFRRYDKKTIRDRFSRFRLIESGYWVFSLFLPVALQRIVKRREANAKVHYMKLPSLINEMFYHFLRIENRLIQYGISLPAGTTLYGICQKESF